MIVELNEKNFDKEAMHGLKLVEFYTTWCMYCKRQRIELIDLENSDIWIGIVDAEESPNIARRYQIEGFPTFVLLKDGKKISEFVGFHEKNQLIAKATKFLNS